MILRTIEKNIAKPFQPKDTLVSKKQFRRIRMEQDILFLRKAIAHAELEAIHTYCAQSGMTDYKFTHFIVVVNLVRCV